MSLLWLLCAFLPASSLGQAKGLPDPCRGDPSVTRVGIQDFKKVQGDKRLDMLEETLPHLLRAGLFSEKRFEVTLLGKASPKDGATAASRELSSPGGGFDLTVEGEILQINENRARVYIIVNDVCHNSVVFRDSQDLDTQQIMAAMGQIADRMTATLREKVLLARVPGRLVAVVGPFDKNAADPKLSFLDTSLPLAISGNSVRTASRKNLVIQTILPGMSSTSFSGTGDIQVTGKISVVGDSLVISGTYHERTGLTLEFEHRGPATEPLKAVDNFSRKVWELFAGRVSPAGGFRDDPLLFANSPSEKRYARGQEYEKSGDGDAALFMYVMALRKNDGNVSARLRLADIYRDREAYTLAEDLYARVLAQNSQNAAAHLGLGLLYSSRGKDFYERAVQELKQAYSLASADPKLLFEACMRLGDTYLLMNQPDLSISAFLRAADLDRTALSPYLSLGKAYRAKKDLDGAFDTLNKGLTLARGDKAAKNDLAAAFNELGKQRRDAKQFAKSVETYQKTIDLDPPDVRLKAAAYFQGGIVYGWDLGGSDNLAKGIAFLEKATEFGPNEEVNWRALGMAYERAEKYKEAVEALNKAISVSPQYESYWELGYTYRLTGDYDSGIASLKKALELDSKKVNGYVLLGALYESKFVKSKDDKVTFGLGVDSLKQAIQLDPRSEAAPRILGILYRYGRDYENSIASLKQAISIRPTVWSYHALGETYWERRKDHDPEDAVAAYTEGLKLDRLYEGIYSSLEVIYAQTGQNEKFVRLLTETTQLQPNFVFPYIKLGLVASDQKKYKEAVAWLEKALTLDRNNEWANRVMGFVYTGIAKRDKNKAAYDTAIDYLNRAIRSKPTGRAYTQLGMIYSDLGNDPKAIENLSQSIDIDPRSQAAYTALEAIYDNQVKHGKPDAMDEFYRVLEVVVAKDPGYLWPRMRLADRYLALRRYDDVIEQASKAIALKPEDSKTFSKAYSQLAQAQWLKPNRELSNATDNARKSLALNPANQGAIWTLAWILFEQKQSAQAVRELEPLLKQNLGSASLHAVLGNAHRLEKSFPQAYQYSKKAIELSPDWAFPRWVLGQSYYDEKKFAEAAASAQEALKLSPEDGDALALFYDSCHQIGKDQEALRFLEQLLAGHPQSRGILSAIGFVSHEYFLVLDYEKSYEAFRKIYDQNHEDWPVVQNFAEANLTTGRFQEVLDLTGQVLSVPKLGFQSRLSMKLLQVAAYLLRGEQGRAFAELGVFREDYSKVPKDYARSWTYDGTKNYVEKHTGLKPAERSLLLRMIALLEAPPAEADAKLRQFEDSFTKTFADLKAAAGSVSKD